MSRFVYYNANPTGDEILDCVNRAIALATNQDYYEVARKMDLTAELWECERTCLSCYTHLLDDVWRLRRVYADDMYVGDFADTHPNGIYIVRMSGHLSCIIDSTIYDIFDCRYTDRITDAWLVE